MGKNSQVNSQIMVYNVRNIKMQPNKKYITLESPKHQWGSKIRLSIIYLKFPK